MTPRAERVFAVWHAWTREESVPTEPRLEPRAERVRIALIIGILAGAFCWFCALRPGATTDFAYPLQAARFFFSGGNPYTAPLGTGVGGSHARVLIFPFTSVVSAMPFAWLPDAAGSALFIAISTAMLAFAITRDGLWRVHIFASSPFVIAALLAQFSPLVTLMGLLPTVGFVALFKPNLGLAMLVRRPTARAIVGCLALLGVSLVIFPRWPWAWLHALRVDVEETRAHIIPVREVGGFLLLLSALCWRRASGRLLLAMSLIPQLPFFYDALPLWLIPRTRKQSLFLTASSQAAFLLWYLIARPRVSCAVGPECVHDLAEGLSLVRSAVPFVIGLLYMPALLLVLWQRERASS